MRRIESAHPNPAVGPVQIQWAQKQESAVRINVYDLHGRLVIGRDFGSVTGGVWVWNWDGKDKSGQTVPKGIYFAKLITDHAVDKARIVRLN